MKILYSIALVLVVVCPVQSQQWKAYYDSTQLYWASDWAKTATLLETAEQSARIDLGLYDPNYLTILNDLGTAYWKAKLYPQAEQVLSKTLSLKAEVYATSDKEVVLSMSNLAGFYAERGSWKLSRSLYRRILAQDPAHIPTDIYLSAAQNLVALYDREQHADSANMLLTRIESWNILQPNSHHAFQHQFFRSKIYRKLQQYQSAETELARLLTTLRNQHNPEFLELYIQCLQEQGILYLETGAYSKAEKSLLEAYQMVTPDLNRDFLLTELSNNLAHVYDKLHIFDKALQYYQESLDRCRLSYAENALPCVILQNNIAGIHLRQENIPLAINAYQKVIAEFEQLLTQSDPLYITALNNLATSHRKNNELKLAEKYLEKAIKLIKDDGKDRNDLAATVLNNIAVLKTAQGEFAKAAEYYRAAYVIKSSIYGENSILLMDLASNLAVTYWVLNRPKDAIPLFKKSIHLATRQVSYVFPNLSENEQVQFYKKLKDDFERFNFIATQWRHNDPGLVSLMFESRMVIKSLQFFTDQRRRKYLGNHDDPALRDLLSRLKDSRDKLGHLYQLPLDHIEKEFDIPALEREVDALEKAISLRSSEALYADGLRPEKITWKSLAAQLRSDEAIVEMVRFRTYDRQSSGTSDVFGFTDSVYYAALIVTSETSNSPEVVVFKDGLNLETRYFNYYKNAMKYNVEDQYSHDFYWDPIALRLDGRKRIFFSSDGVYHRINVNTFRDRKTKALLLEEYDVVYLLNPVQILEAKEATASRKRSAVLIGDPAFDVDVNKPRERTLDLAYFGDLPGTHQELQAIAKVLKAQSWNTRLLVRDAATEANLKSVTSPSILHLASHGFFSSDVVPLNAEAKKDFLFHSGIVLTGANASLAAAGSTSSYNDGIVTAYEVMGLDLSNTQLVVLSACETGLGKVENGEGVFGLQRSFMQAGARNVVISLWKVDDGATRDLMIKFYKYIAAGQTFRDALKRAQMDQARVLSDPSLWGGFVLVGNN